MIIQGADIKVIVLNFDEHHASLSGGFLQCLVLEEWVKNRPSTFVVDCDGKRTTYTGVQWEGDVRHSCSEEMSACIGEVKFNYKSRCDA